MKESWKLLRKDSRIDSDLVRDIAAVASPIQIAVMLDQFGL